MKYFVYNRHFGWSHGTPADPQVICEEDGKELMKRAGISKNDVLLSFPPAQFAEEGDELFEKFGGNRYLMLADIERCAGKQEDKINKPLKVSWD
jgi:hypothetical protein